MRQMNVTLRNEYFVSVLREDITQIFTNIQIFDKTTNVLPSGSIKSSSKDLNSDGIKE